MKRPFGQHFLSDPGILRKIMDCAGVAQEDTVVEIGAGPGAMTRLLAERAKKVIAIEIDKRLIPGLNDLFSAAPHVEIISADALKFPLDTIKGKFKVVANIPYYITTPLLFRLLEFREKITGMTLLLQKEVAERIVASPGNKDYGVLSISIQLLTKPTLKFLVRRGSFSPPPKVDSSVVNFDICPNLPYEVKNEELLRKIIRTAFSQRRKTILNSLKSFGRIKDALEAAGIAPKLRPENLSIEDFVAIANILAE
ncbi:MAG: ribosomal RNA small subunit methyltransferase A [Nitrospirae bacterium]|nr:ribosomal RNA small subunit methyltransferase A [Nitrospirota bacterium]